MKLSRNELLAVMIFCDHEAILKFLPKRGKILCCSSKLLEDYECTWDAILRSREYNINHMHDPDHEMPNDCQIILDSMYTRQHPKALTLIRKNPFYDGRDESILTIDKRTNTGFDRCAVLIGQDMCEMLLETSYRNVVKLLLQKIVKDIDEWADYIQPRLGQSNNPLLQDHIKSVIEMVNVLKTNRYHELVKMRVEAYMTEKLKDKRNRKRKFALLRKVKNDHDLRRSALDAALDEIRDYLLLIQFSTQMGMPCREERQNTYLMAHVLSDYTPDYAMDCAPSSDSDDDWTSDD